MRRCIVPVVLAILLGIASANPSALSFRVGTLTVVEDGLLQRRVTVALANEAEDASYQITSIRAPNGASIGSASAYPHPLGSMFSMRPHRPPQDGVYTAVVSGEEGPVELEVELKTPDFLDPPLFTVEETPRGLRIRWTAVERAEGYLLKLRDSATSGEREFLRLATTVREITVLRPLPAGTYEIVVQAYDFSLTDLLIPPKALDVAAFPTTFAMSEATQIIRIDP